MKKNVRVGLTIAFVATLGIGTYLLLHKAKVAREVPQLSARSGEAKPSSEFLNAQKAVEYYRDEIRKNPDAVKNYVELAQLFVQEA